METKLRAVMVGCGGMSAAWLHSAKQIPAVQVIGLMDIREEAARKRAEEFGLNDAVVDTDLESILKKAKPDLVFDCTVPEAHCEVVTTALRHGCHVLGEKPMADSMDRARQMVRAAEEAQRIYAVTQNYRYNPNIRRLKTFLTSGAIGPLSIVNADFYLGPHFGGFRDRMKHVLLLDMSIHTFDASRFLTGADPVAVTCLEWNPRGSWYDHDAAAVALFEMSNGIRLTYRGCWCAEGLNTSWNSEWRLLGEKGSIKWDGEKHLEAAVVTQPGQPGTRSEIVPVEPPLYELTAGTGGHLGLMREFAECVRTGSKPETHCADNIKSLSMVFGAIESAESGGKRVGIQ